MAWLIIHIWQFGEFNALQRHFQGEYSLFPIVCNEPNAIMWHFLKEHHFYPLFIVHVFTVQISR